jgi:hypothetical protein
MILSMNLKGLGEEVMVVCFRVLPGIQLINIRQANRIMLLIGFSFTLGHADILKFIIL